MNQLTLAEAARQVLFYMAPLLAMGALQKIGEHVTDTTLELLERAWNTLARRFNGHAEAEAALTLFKAKPQDTVRQQLVEAQIVERFDEDPAAREELLALARAIAALQPPPPAPAPRSVNTYGNSKIGYVNQGDIGGDAHFGPVDFSTRSFSSGVQPPGPASAPATAALTPAAPTTAPATFTNGYALLIGVGRYAQSRLNAPATATDAQRLAELLRDPTRAAYPPGQVQLLSDVQASRAGVLAALDALAAQVAANPGATVLIFFAGHGMQCADDYFLLPYDCNHHKPAESAIDAATFRAKIDAIGVHAQKLLLLLNCCHAGGVGDGVLSEQEDERGAGAPPPANFYAPLGEGSGRVIISAARAEQRAAARSHADRALTVFGAQLLAALNGAGAGPAVTLFELFTTLAQTIPPDARHTTDPRTGAPLKQNPLIFARALDSDFALALRPLPQRSNTLSAPPDNAVARLIELEMQLAAYASEREAPAELVAERDALLKALG